MTYNIKILRIWITIIRHGGLSHEVQESWPYLSNATKESIYMRKEFNSQRIFWVHQHGRHFIVLEHQHGRRDVM